MQLKSGSAASNGGGASKMAFPVGDWELDKNRPFHIKLIPMPRCQPLLLLHHGVNRHTIQNF
ncbi:MAG: hypothetical protein V7L27_24610 [Nostoc sp.]|uniref:hypothetical protein n=1 Tax=Nostoc sp. TaxID=1180 RepID=UPI002FFBFFCC